jgi:DNA-binding NarL/FixJ family response regulator
MVSNNEDTVLKRIAQLETQIQDAKIERRNIQAQLIAELSSKGLSSRKIAERVNLSHVTVHHMLAGYKAAQG